ncbi:hypothetical protein [Streptomyces sp. NBRC 110465]|uniref:hypothetical protein n=1 Tax=Streptomyces sp. NBRC 110465 TaxID=1897621 RepID=UPI000933D621|nr:hypothetical protein [Streptomyces sp. NBRC 110465]
MTNLTDECGTDPEIYKRPFPATVLDEPTYQQAVHDFRARKANPAAQPQAPAGAPSRSAPARRAS